jgi:hypothetical protein
MNEELSHAQQSLTEEVIRKFWRVITFANPNICVTDGLVIDYHSHFQERDLQQIVHQLVKCSEISFVATPLFQYFYDPPNKETKHHCTALTLTKLPDQAVLSFFDPKGTGTLRPFEQAQFLKLLSVRLSAALHKPVAVKVFSGENLQKNDDIGLCQLFSLLYLYEYVQQVSKLDVKNIHAQSRSCFVTSGGHKCFDTLHTIVDPNAMVEMIKAKHGSYSNRTLHKFWIKFFGPRQMQPKHSVRKSIPPSGGRVFRGELG